MYQNSYVPSNRFKYANDQILYYGVDYKNKLQLYKFQMRVYRDNKEHHFSQTFSLDSESLGVSPSVTIKRSMDLSA